MPPSLNPLESRSLSTGLAQRTIKNLDFVQKAHDCGEDVHIVMQMLNSTLGLLVFPVAKENTFFSSFRSTKLSSQPDFGAVKIPGFPPLPSLTISMFGNCADLRRFFIRLRNAISHRRLAFSDESHARLDRRAQTRCDVPSDEGPALAAPTAGLHGVWAARRFSQASHPLPGNRLDLRRVPPDTLSITSSH
jgi:hypothetical protein